MTKHEAPLLDASVRIDNIPAEGRPVQVEATVAQRDALTKVLKVDGLDAFSAELLAKRFRSGIRVEGRVRASVVQPCVVTLVPVRQDIDELVDRVFLPEHKGRPAPGAEIFVDLEEDDLPDVLEGPEADLSPLLIETIALAIDPYPRAPGAVLESVPVPDEPLEASPFARLAVLKQRGKG